MAKIHKDMTIDEIISLFPNKAEKLTQAIAAAGLHCVGCHAATWETLEVGMLSHGKTEPEMNALIKKLNALLEEEVDMSTISMTQAAAERFSAYATEEGKKGWHLRLGEKMAGCNGFEYELSYSEKASADDTIFPSQGLEIHVKKYLVPRFLGIEIDFVEGLNGGGFKISNPNVKSACGCGTSHGY